MAYNPYVIWISIDKTDNSSLERLTWEQILCSLIKIEFFKFSASVSEGFILFHFEQERAEQRKLKVHEKTTYSQKIKTRTRIMTKEEIMEEDEDKLPAVEDYPSFNATFAHG